MFQSEDFPVSAPQKYSTDVENADSNSNQESNITTDLIFEESVSKHVKIRKISALVQR